MSQPYNMILLRTHDDDVIFAVSCRLYFKTYFDFCNLPLQQRFNLLPLIYGVFPKRKYEVYFTGEGTTFIWFPIL